MTKDIHQMLTRRGFTLIRKGSPHRHTDPIVTLGREAIRVNALAYTELGSPPRVLIFISPDQIALFPAKSDTPEAYSIHLKALAVTSTKLLAIITSAGWEPGHYPMQVEPEGTGIIWKSGRLEDGEVR